MQILLELINSGGSEIAAVASSIAKTLTGIYTIPNAHCSQSFVPILEKHRDRYPLNPHQWCRSRL